MPLSLQDAHAIGSALHRFGGRDAAAHRELSLSQELSERRVSAHTAPQRAGSELVCVPWSQDVSLEQAAGGLVGNQGEGRGAPILGGRVGEWVTWVSGLISASRRSEQPSWKQGRKRKGPSNHHRPGQHGLVLASQLSTSLVSSFLLPRPTLVLLSSLLGPIHIGFSVLHCPAVYTHR